MSASEPPVRRRLRERYALGRRLGGGGQGTTWEAVDEAEGRRVAIKEFRIRGAASWKDVELAEREATVLSRLEHPLLPAYVDHFEESGALYLVMQLIEGQPISAKTDHSTEEVIRFLEDAASVLDYLHDQAPPVIHRDIKPSNVIRTPEGRFAVVDFGAVRAELAPEGGSTIVGTFGYMAPEQFQGRALPVTDVYAVGATAISMLTGQAPEDLPHRGLGIDVRAALAPTRAPSVLIDALEAMLQPDPDVRPKELGPVVAAVRSGRAPRPTPGPAWSPDPAATPAAEDEPNVLVLPPGPAAAFRIILAVARVAVAIALGALVPMILTLLSVAFGPALRRAARSVQGAGRRADAALADASRMVARDRDGWRRGRHRGRSRRRVRVASPLGNEGRDSRPRVATDEPQELVADSDENENENEADRRPHHRR